MFWHFNTSNAKRQPACAPYKTRHSMSAFKHGKSTAASVCVQKGCTSRTIRLENTALQVLKFYSLILRTFWETWYLICYHKALTVLFQIFLTFSAHYIKKEVWPHILNYPINGQMFCRVGTVWKSYYNDTQNPFRISRSGMVPPSRVSLFPKWRNFNMGSNWYTSVTYDQNSVHTYKFSLLDDH